MTVFRYVDRTNYYEGRTMTVEEYLKIEKRDPETAFYLQQPLVWKKPGGRFMELAYRKDTGKDILQDILQVLNHTEQ